MVIGDNVPPQTIHTTSLFARLPVSVLSHTSRKLCMSRNPICSNNYVFTGENQLTMVHCHTESLVNINSVFTLQNQEIKTIKHFNKNSSSSFFFGCVLFVFPPCSMPCDLCFLPHPPRKLRPLFLFLFWDAKIFIMHFSNVEEHTNKS